jgi:hypothetical protein
MGDQQCLDAIISGAISGAFEDDEVYELRENALSNCTQLVSVSLPACTKIEGNSIKGCTNLTSVNLPECTNAQGYAFDGCTKLASVSLPKCTNATANVFSGCTKLESVTLANTALGTNLFKNRSYLTSLTLTARQVVTLDSSALSGTPIASGNGTVYVPSDLVSAYQADSNWSQFNIAAIQA